MVQGKPCKVLLDSGASGNFISHLYLAAHHDIVSTPLHTLLSIRQADGQTSVATHFVELGLQISSLQSRVNCIPAPLSHYDVVLGKPWLTDMNPDINWRLNAVSLQSEGSVHVLLGCAQTHLPAIVISALDAQSIVDDGGSSCMSGKLLLNPRIPLPHPIVVCLTPSLKNSKIF
jgi:hypothetical protein